MYRGLILHAAVVLILLFCFPLRREPSGKISQTNNDEPRTNSSGAQSDQPSVTIDPLIVTAALNDSPTIPESTLSLVGQLSSMREAGKTLSPGTIEELIGNKPGLVLSPLWESLGLAKVDTDALLTKCSDKCEIERYPIPGNALHVNEEVLRIATSSVSYRYLVLKRKGALSEDNWELLGHIDVPYNKYGPPEEKIMTIGETGTWLMIKQWGTSGTGLALYFDNWYDLTNDGVKEALSYPDWGYEGGWNEYTDKEFHSRLLSQSVINGRYVVSIQFSISYAAGMKSRMDRDVPLFSKKRIAWFVWNPESDKFTLDPRSELTETELDGEYTDWDDPDSLTNEQFLIYNYKELSRLAFSGTVDQKKWLSKFLQVCKNTSEKRSLSVLLGQR